MALPHAPDAFATQTIIAPASALGGGVAVLRISGPLAGLVFRKLVQAPLQAPRVAQLVTLKHPETGRILDKALALYFQNPASFTGEDVLELHVHGGRAVVQRILAASLSLDPSIRLAEPGEFSKRAYLNGKMDLTEAEAIADLVAAETEAQADLAMAQMGGALRDLYESWHQELKRRLAYMEAGIDFVDEEDIPQDILDSVHHGLELLENQLRAHLDDHALGERLRDGFTVAVIGAPNAGKSSLVNALAKRDVAIVSPVAGTTRDTIEVHLNLGGYPVILVDTAGLRATSDVIEAEGIKRAKARVDQADIVLALFDATQEKDDETSAQVTPETLVFRTKSDLLPKGREQDHANDAPLVSTATGHGMDTLLAALTDRIASLAAPKSSMPLLTRARHRESVNEALSHIIRARGNPHPELMAEDMRMAMRALGRITGRVDVEDLLDVIFRDFCIGK